MRRLFFCLMTVFLFQLELPGSISADVGHYPLQTKYPDIMLYQGEIPNKLVALTFDDGPDDLYTPKILDVLDKYDTNATFFLMGSRVEKNPDIAKRIVEKGHAIGNHTYWHPELTKAGVNTMKREMNKTAKEIEQATGQHTSLFRAPYGDLNEHLVEKIGDMGYRGIGWSIDTNDWREPPSESIVRNVMDYAHPGAIILMHSAGSWKLDLSNTVEALDTLIPKLKKEGYTFVTIPEMWYLTHP